MFCSIKKGKKTFRIYVCDRKRIDGKVVSKDINIGSYQYFVLYRDVDTDSICDILFKMVKEDLIDNGVEDEKYLNIVVDKLIALKKEYYTTYMENQKKSDEEDRIAKVKEREQRLAEYTMLKDKYKDLYESDLSKKFSEGYNKGRVDGIDFESLCCSDEKVSMGTYEKKLLKEAMKLLSHKHHPDKGGSHDTMVVINRLKEKLSI